MSAPEDIKKEKICIIVLDSKRALSFDKCADFCAGIAKYGYYADKVVRVAYDDTQEIVRTFANVKEDYFNTFVMCPKSMDKTVKDYLSNLYGAQFGALGVMTVGDYAVGVIHSDSDGRLSFEDIRDAFAKKFNKSYDKVYIKFVGAPQDLLAQALQKARSLYSSRFGEGEIYFNLDAKFDDCCLEIVYSSATTKMLIDEVQRVIVSHLREYIYAFENVSLAEQLFRLLQLRRLKISVAESFTGGGVGKKLVEVPGVSEVYIEGLNTYSNLSKQQRLGVTELTLKQCGAVSAETAYQMAEGLLKTGVCDVAISTTGIAGPKSDNTAKPVGLAYIAVGVGEDISVYRFNFTGDRERITNCAINRALFLAYKRLK